MLVVGAASRDLTADDPRGWRLGGAVTYAALTLARLGLDVQAVVGVDDEAATAAELDVLRAAGVQLHLDRLRRAPVFVNDERPEGRIQRCVDVSDAMDPGSIPPAWQAPEAVFLGPVAGELGPAWAEVASPTATVALGWQGILRNLAAGEPVRRRPPEPVPLLQRADLVGVSADDVGPEIRLSTLVDLIRPGATLVMTRGLDGGTVLTSNRPARSSLRAYPAIPSDGVVDATGAGDVFLAALFAAMVTGGRLAGPSLSARLTFAAAAASVAVEGAGTAGVPTLAAVRRRVADVA